MSYRESDDPIPDTDQRPYLCMRAFALDVGGDGENIAAHKWMNAMRKLGWHLVTITTGQGDVKVSMGMTHRGEQYTTVSRPIITIVMAKTDTDHNKNQYPSVKDPLWPVQTALTETAQPETSYYGGEPHW